MRERKFKDLTGQVFNRLTVKKFSERKNKCMYYECVCVCGNVCYVRGASLKNGHTKSCGCLHKEMMKARKKGNRGTPAYISWGNMKARCNNLKNPHYDRYGGRGITVCKEWESFDTFYEDMGDRPEGMTLDRKDNNKGYSPLNCKWSTREEQQNNMSTNVVLRYDNKVLTLAQWARELNVSRRLLAGRYERGWATEEILAISI